MKCIKAILSSIATLLISSSYADTTDIQHSGKISLDESQDVFFDQLPPAAFTLQLLQIKNKFKKRDLILGGSAQFDFQHWQGDQLVITPPPPVFYQQGNGGYFTQTTFDAMTQLNNHWTTLFLSLADSHIGQNAQYGNYVYVPHAFLTLGNLDKFPLYFTAGINTIPFGDFSGSGTWNTPLTALYFNPIQAPQLSLGYYKNGWNFAATQYEDQTNYIHHNAYNFSYANTVSAFNYSLGGGYLTHLQSNATGNTTITRNLLRSINSFSLGDIWDYNASIGYGGFSLAGEYLTGSKKVNMNRNNPGAISETASYTHSILGKDTTFGIGHSNSLYLRDVPTSLEGQNATPYAASGLRQSWVLSAWRPIFTKNFTLGLNAEKDWTFQERQTYTYTLDFMAYL